MGNFGNKRKPISEQVYADSEVWQCSTCAVWSRDEFIYIENPACPMCRGDMERVTKSIRIE
ncbi:cold-inducible protein YdjO-related protein [Ferroacidibacillus organovorans]